MTIDTEERCERTDLIVSQCAHCRPKPSLDDEIAQHRARLLASRRGWFRAQYFGRCAGCGDPYVPDTAIRRTPDGYIAECCAEDT